MKLPPQEPRKPHRVAIIGHSGQLLISFAILVPVLIGMLGLAMDGGMLLLERRTVQNAADAGALAGAHAVARWSKDHPNRSALSDVEKLAGATADGGRFRNAIGGENVIEECVYVTNSYDPETDAGILGACDAPVPSDAAGVRVSVSEEHSTFFIQVLFGSAKKVHITATATAFVQRASADTLDAGNAPFVVCGANARTTGGKSIDIVSRDGKIQESAIDETFYVWGSGPSAPAACGGNSFFGPAATTYNSGAGVGDFWYGVNGKKVGIVLPELKGIGGCNGGESSEFRCVAILPIATDSPKADKVKIGKDQVYEFKVVALAPFLIEDCSGNCQAKATLLANYVVPGPGTPNWCRDCGGAVTIRLTE